MVPIRSVEDEGGVARYAGAEQIVHSNGSQSPLVPFVDSPSDQYCDMREVLFVEAHGQYKRQQGMPRRT